MSQSRKIKSALISVYHKDNLDTIIHKLNNLGVEIISTGGTKSFVESLGVQCKSVEDLTSYPSILGGRVKTLHPKVFGGILNRRELSSDQQQIKEYDIPEIDLVIVDLYPFEATVESGASEAEIIEKIDIGGISLIRAAAKNFNDVLIVSGVWQYQKLIDVLEEGNGFTTLDTRKDFALEAFNTSSHYDAAIFSYFNREAQKPVFKQSLQEGKTLRYGENPHQKGLFYGDFEGMFTQLNGKEISYNNLLDIDAAVSLIQEFDETTFAILKHNNACGLASRNNLVDAWKDALAGDPVSAFGGVLITNKEIDTITAEEINKLFFEVIIAPSYESKALEILKSKKNRIILVIKNSTLPIGQFRSLLNGVLAQDKDQSTEMGSQMKPVTRQVPKESELEDLVFANKLVKHTKSNAIVFAKNRQLVSSGVGQTSRVDALRQAIAKAESFGFNLEGAVMASDAFFPFPDCVEIASQVGITAVVQPGGSVKDQDSIDFCDSRGMSMVFTGIRHFRH
jgi:phosphoribosylaminoimidazolecarboxamide formyltransferase / IMP cyclohydrolase